MNDAERQEFDNMIGFIIRSMGGEVKEPISKGIEHFRAVEQAYVKLLAEKASWEAERSRLVEELRVATVSNQRTDRLPTVGRKADPERPASSKESSTDFLPTIATTPVKTDKVEVGKVDPAKAGTNKIEAKKSFISRLFGG